MTQKTDERQWLPAVLRKQQIVSFTQAHKDDKARYADIEKYVEYRREINPWREQAAWEGVRHRVAFAAGWILSIGLGVLIAVLEAIGVTFGYAIKRQPVIFGPALGALVLSLMLQTLRYRGPFTWQVIHDFVSRATVVALIVALAGALVFGLIHWWTAARSEAAE